MKMQKLSKIPAGMVRLFFFIVHYKIYICFHSPFSPFVYFTSMCFKYIYI